MSSLLPLFLIALPQATPSQFHILSDFSARQNEAKACIKQKSQLVQEVDPQTMVDLRIGVAVHLDFSKTSFLANRKQEAGKPD